MEAEGYNKSQQKRKLEEEKILREQERI